MITRMYGRLTVPSAKLMRYVSIRRRYENRYNNEVRKLTKRGVRRFTSLTKIDEQIKKDLLSNVRHCEIVLAKHDVRNSRSRSILIIFMLIFQLTIISLIVLIPSSKIITFGIIPVSHLITLYMNTGMVILLLSVFPMVGLILGGFKSTDRIKLFLIRWFVILTSAYFVVIYASIQQNRDVLLADPLITCLLIVSIYIASLIFLIILNSYRMRRFRTQRIIQAPVEVLVGNSVKILSLIENNSNKWIRLEFKQDIISLIEEMADSIENGLPNCVTTEDYVTSEWFTLRSVRIAAAIRDLKKWILMPKNDTLVLLNDFIASGLINIVKGAWDNLPQTEPQPKPSLRKQLLNKLISFSKALPALIWIIYQQSQSSFHGPIADAFTLVAAVWLITVLLSVLDVDMNVLKDSLDIFPIFGRKP